MNSILNKQQSTIWSEGEDGTATHMVFGLVISSAGTIHAFAEARIHPGDEEPHRIVLKRSLDQGLSWEAGQIIEQSANGECWANPTALADRTTGKLFLFYALNDKNVSTRMFYRVSCDDGLTWSDRNEITPVAAENNPYGWTLFLPGPGHGIQLRDGRLLLPYWGRKAISLPQAERMYGNGVLYSDDGGETWEAGGPIPLRAELGNNESRVVELANGDLLLNARANGFNRRIVSISTDRGKTWSEPASDQSFPPRWGCDSGLTVYPDGNGEADTLLYSTITHKRTAAENGLELSVSFDGGRSWPVRKTLYEGPCSYSDIAVMPDHTIIVLLGAGSCKQAPSFAKEVQLIRLPMEWLTN